jgi:hypothetical protein
VCTVVPRSSCRYTLVPRSLSSSYPRRHLIVVLLPPKGCCPETSYTRRHLIVVLFRLMTAASKNAHFFGGQAPILFVPTWHNSTSWYNDPTMEGTTLCIRASSLFSQSVHHPCYISPFLVLVLVLVLSSPLLSSSSSLMFSSLLSVHRPRPRHCHRNRNRHRHRPRPRHRPISLLSSSSSWSLFSPLGLVIFIIIVLVLVLFSLIVLSSSSRVLVIDASYQPLHWPHPRPSLCRRAGFVLFDCCICCILFALISYFPYLIVVLCCCLCPFLGYSHVAVPPGKKYKVQGRPRSLADRRTSPEDWPIVDEDWAQKSKIGRSRRR